MPIIIVSVCKIDRNLVRGENLGKKKERAKSERRVKRKEGLKGMEREREREIEILIVSLYKLVM